MSDCFEFKVDLFNDNGKYHITIPFNISCKYWIKNDLIYSVSMEDVVAFLKQQNFRKGWSVYTTHEYGFPVIVKF